MNSLNFTLDGVGLRTNHGGITSYPKDIKPYNHQLDMADIINNKDDFTAINTAPTGGGKTLSWVSPAVNAELDVLAAFPTNALVHDQKASIENYKDNNIDNDTDLGIEVITSETLESARSKDSVNLSNGELIERIIREGKRQYKSFIVLTNPDIFVRLRRGLYKNTYAKNQCGKFDIVVFDEFHLSDTKGWNSILFYINEMYADPTTDTSKFIFLSATPEDEIYDRIKNGLSIPNHYDCAKDEGEDRHTGRKPWSEVSELDGWRPVMPPVDVELRGSHIFSTADHLLDDDEFSDVLSFCRQGRTVIMLDAIKEVERVYEALDTHLSDSVVHRYDGMKNQNIEQKLEEFDVLISNSAVEVGIDFEVDQIIMSGYERKAFLQRIGRLRNNKKKLNAICYVPRQTLDGFRNEIETALEWLEANNPLPRWRFEEIVSGLFPAPRDPDLYPRMYSTVEAFSHIDDKQKRLSSDMQREYYLNAMARFEKLFFTPDGEEMTEERLAPIMNKSRSPMNQEGAFKETMQSYRNSGLSTLVFDKTEDRVKTYDLFYFLRNGRVEFVTKEEFWTRVPMRHAKDIGRNDSYAVGYCIYHGPRKARNEEDTGRTAKLGATQELGELIEMDVEDREPVTLTGLEVRVDEPIPGLEKLNQYLAAESFLCYPMEGTSYRIQQEFNLDNFFFLYDLTDVRGKATVLAMGLNALYLHCHMTKRLESQREMGAFSV